MINLIYYDIVRYLIYKLFLKIDKMTSYFY